jgi:hypothetical protein
MGLVIAVDSFGDHWAHLLTENTSDKRDHPQLF